MHDDSCGPLIVMALGQLLMTHDFRGLRPKQYQQFKELLSDSTFVVANLEPALGIPGVGAPTRPKDSPTHVMPLALLPQVEDLGINLISAASNHTWDLGTASIEASIQNLQKSAFAFSGVGMPRQDSLRAGTISRRGHTASVLSMATGKIRPGAAATAQRAGVNELRLSPDGTLDAGDAEENLREIARCRELGHYTAVVHHNHEWEKDKSVTPKWLIEWAHSCIDAGADLFLGHGAPLLQGIEVYRGRPILYNLGSFVFNCSSKTKWDKEVYWHTAVIRIACGADGSLTEMEILPVLLDKESDPFGFPTCAVGETARTIVDSLSAASKENFGTLFSSDGKWLDNKKVVQNQFPI